VPHEVRAGRDDDRIGVEEVGAAADDPDATRRTAREQRERSVRRELGAEHATVERRVVADSPQLAPETDEVARVALAVDEDAPNKGQSLEHDRVRRAGDDVDVGLRVRLLDPAERARGEDHVADPVVSHDNDATWTSEVD
jgi:hypothetical protein